ncbi:hypothetical protein L0663_02065 [Dyadobacter sp. CY107]|nr:hypothetical protein [Dyadobacter fanqingshengii]MCF2502149.1 hypothetical protein [Dyadobacter fanqingshengii]
MNASQQFTKLIPSLLTILHYAAQCRKKYKNILSS